jgi:hypothetical protein
MPKWCVIQPGRGVSQVGPVPAFTQRRVAHTMSRCFIFLLICHWSWIGWRGNPTLKAAIRKGLVIIIGEKEFVGQISSVRQSTGRTCTDPASVKLIIISITLKQSSGQNMNTLIKEIN